MTNAKMTVAVAGGTGRAGSAYVRELLDAGYRVRASHRPGTDPAASLPAGTDAVEADLLRPEAAARLTAGADALFIGILGRGADSVAREEAITRNLIEAARASGVERVVYTSVHRADEPTGVPHFEVKDGLERAIRASGLHHTILRPVTYMEGFNAPWLRSAVRNEGVLRSPISPDAPISYIATSDLARFGLTALEDSRLDGATLPLGGPETLTYREVVPILSEQLGREITYRRLPLERVEATSGPDIAAMIRLFNADGFVVEMEAAYAEHGVEPTTLRSFLERSGWGEASPRSERSS